MNDERERDWQAHAATLTAEHFTPAELLVAEMTYKAGWTDRDQKVPF